jgi:cytochrome c biogenesis protein CcdA
MLIVGLVLIWLAPVKTKSVVANVSTSGKEAGMSLLYGIMAFAVLVILPVILMVTLIGIPLGFLLSMTGILIWTFGTLFAEIALGRTLLKLFGFEEENYFLYLLTGRAVTLLVGWIPCLGGLYKFILFLLALGGIVRVKMNLINRRSELVKKKTVKKKNVKKKNVKKKPVKKTKSKKKPKKK